MSAPTARGALVLLDADIIYPIQICDFFLTAAETGLIAKPVVTDTILDEAHRNLLADRPHQHEAIDRRFANVRAFVDSADVTIPARLHDVDIVNAKDRHVLAAARHHRVDYIITNDARLRREIQQWAGTPAPRRRPRAAFNANDYTARLVHEDPAAVRNVIGAMAARFRNPPRSESEVLQALSRSLPSLAAI